MPAVIDRAADRVQTPSRRDVLAGLAAIAAALWGCDRSRTESTATPPLATGTPARPPLPKREPILRVRVHTARGTAPSARIGSEGQRLRVGHSGGTEVVLAGPVEARIGDGAWSVVDAKGSRAPSEALDPLEVAAIDEPAPILAMGDRRYPGPMRLVARSDVGPRDFDVVSLVAMEAYVPGVVAGELYEHWHLATRAAQAIAARSFAASERYHFSSRRHFDVTNTPASQVYLGAVTHADTLEAVLQTAGVMLAFEGRLVPGYYSSCCGGTAACATDAIGPSPANDTAPLRGREGCDVCTDARVARWTIERPLAELSARVRAYGRRRSTELAELGTVAALEVTSTNAHGRPTRYAVADTEGRRVELSAEALRAAVNFSGASLEAPGHPLWSSHVSMTVLGESAVFEGRGYGHGVGLCQHGAETLARRGEDHREILEWYYPEVELVKAY